MLKDKVVFISGSSRGIGAATARIAVSQGAKVILHGKTDSAHLKKMAAELQAEYVFFDIADEKAVKQSVSELLKRVPKIDGLCNIAGAPNPVPFLETTEDDWLYSYKVNVLGTVNLCRELIPHMQKNKSGRIVNIGSIRGYAQGSFAERLAYSSAKAAVINITAGLAKEFAKDKILINSVSPGGVDTDIAKNWDEKTRQRNTNVPLQRLAQPEEIGNMVCFLLSDLASYITGQDFLVDGGYTIGNS